MSETAEEAVDAEASGDPRVDPPLDMFAEGAPAVAIGGVDVMRSTIVATPEDQADRASIHWHVSTIPTGDEAQPVVVMGDLSVTQNGWFIGTTVAFLISFRDAADMPDLADDRSVNDLGDVLGPWASNALYDVAALVARQMVAVTTRCDVEIPRITPRAHLTQMRRTEDQVEDSPLA